MDQVVDTGTYEVLRARLSAAADELTERARALNTRRLEVFGASELRLGSSGRLRTAGPCTPQDLVAVGGFLLLGHRPPLSVGGPLAVGDVLTLHEKDLAPAGPDAVPGLLDDPRLQQDFAELHRYYREARIEQLRLTDGRLLAVFRTGPAAGDLRVLRWQLSPDGTPRYLDARGERDHVRPDGQQLHWAGATRDDHVPGPTPQLSLGGELLLATGGGTLTLSTPAGRVLHREPLDESLQTLADAEIAHARLDTLLVVRIRPYQEETVRHLVCHLPSGRISRIDAVGQACLHLPGDQGLAFPGGYHLTDGTVRTFDQPTDALGYERTVLAPNGEDVLYAFRDEATGRTLLLPYNTVRQEASVPLACQGYALLDDGTLAALRTSEDGPGRLHTVQLWQTPYVSERHAAAQPAGDGPLARIGNADLVTGLADCLALARLATAPIDTTHGYTAVLAACSRTADRHHWLAEPGLGDLHQPLRTIRDTARQVLAEHESVTQVTAHAAQAVDQAAERSAALLRLTRGENLTSATAWVTRLGELRHAQGQVESLRELRRADTARIDRLAADLLDGLTEAARRAATFLAEPDAFADHLRQATTLTSAARTITTAAEAAPLGEQTEHLAEALATVGDLVTTLDLTDPTLRTGILERLAAVLAETNRATATLAVRRRELRTREATAEFAAETALLAQATTAALAAADTPQACDDQLGRLQLRIEQLETRFADADPALTEQLTDRRTEIDDTLTTRKQTLLDERARRADRLADSATRVLDALRRRLATLSGPGEVDAALAADPMAAKIRHLAEQLADLGETARAEEVTGHLRAAREEAHHALRDRGDLYTDGGTTLRLGRHHFAVTTQRPELTLVPWQGRPTFALTGTDYRSPVTRPDFDATRRYWDQHLPSETPDMYRAEYLAASLVLQSQPLGLEALNEAQSTGRLLELVRREVEARPDEGYQRGVHDHDATTILDALLHLHADAGPLRHPAAARAAAQLFWAHGTDETTRSAWTTRARSLALARSAYGPIPAFEALTDELDYRIAEFTDRLGLAAPPRGGSYLAEELAHHPHGFAIAAPTTTLLEKFHATEDAPGLTDALKALPDTPADLAVRHQLAYAWLESFAVSTGEALDGGDLAEATTAVLCPDLPRFPATGTLRTTLTGLLGDHPRLRNGTLIVRLAELLSRTADFTTHQVPGFRAYQRLRTTLLDTERRRLHLHQYRPAPLSGFVRNRLIDEVYLPLIGDNLAKQLGATGDAAHADRSGLMLLISPPGYGKTTLVEYVAARLGLLLVKVNGPALGHRTTSLDPADAPDATARQEIEKLNFALHAGNNVLLYLDDIQHASAELLQRFIPLCDAQRRIDGIQDGQARGYDLRGKRFAVVMAANPYTESGHHFRIPDMLANRADVWNLGDVLAGREDLFELSFIENCLTANAHIAPLAGRDRADLEVLLRRASGEPADEPLSHPYPPADLDRMTAVLAKLQYVRDTVLTVNRAYIASAAQSDHSRTEPPFRLQGSYRDMAKLAERIVPVMDDRELDALIEDHYRAEAQSLGAEAEAQLLKLAELRGTLSPTQADRWAAIKAGGRHAS
ncbi:DNA repair ATPase [Kitasatospora sp. CMC57]|uniref:DNA repair ATPase n=1 Tax=Kitasatospora sp. CMC57 TaxID=3231513 RepID=A0AB33KAJ2_9ACTN